MGDKFDPANELDAQQQWNSIGKTGRMVLNILLLQVFIILSFSMAKIPFGNE
jgi:hypothetical protein